MDWLGYCVSRIGRNYGVVRTPKEAYKYFVYSSIIRYKVMGFTYEINAGDYGRAKPIVGRRVLVVYNEWNPEWQM